MSDWWPAIKVKRFSGEPMQAYAARKVEVSAIISGFRKGRFEGALADRLDARLEALLSGDYDQSRTTPTAWSAGNGGLAPPSWKSSRRPRPDPAHKPSAS